MLVVGLTGGVGSGKSTAARMFAELGAEIVDTDAIAHALTAPGQPVLAEIAAEFGASLVANGVLDRTALRRLVFNDPAARKKLENLLHPLIRRAVADVLVQPTAAPYCMVVVPLLLETGGYPGMVQRVLVVDCPEAVQVERAMARSALTESEVCAIMAAQLPRMERLRRADDVIVNDGGLNQLARQVGEMHKKYLRLA